MAFLLLRRCAFAGKTAKRIATSRLRQKRLDLYFCNKYKNTMGRKLTRIELTDSEESTLRTILQKGTHNSREYKRAQILLKLQAGAKPTAISLEVYCSPATVKAVKKRYLSGGLDRALKDAPRSGAPAKVTEYHEADITAIACTVAPKGRGKWTAELLSDELVKLGYEEGHSPSTVRRILKKVNLSLGRKGFGASES